MVTRQGEKAWSRGRFLDITFGTPAICPFPGDGWCWCFLDIELEPCMIHGQATAKSSRVFAAPTAQVGKLILTSMSGGMV